MAEPIATSSEAGPSMPGARQRRFDNVAIANTVLPLIALAGMVIYFAGRSPSFLTLSNLTVMTGQAGPLLLASLGATFVIVMGSIDLSVASIALVTGSVCAWFLANHASVGLWVIVIGLAVGALCGLVSGVVYAYGRVPSFVTTLGMLSILSGLGLKIIDGSPLPFINSTFTDLAIGQTIPNIQNAGIWALAIWAVMVLVAFRTRFGLYMYAIGGGEQVSRLSGVRVNRYKVYAFVLSGLTAAFSGILSVGQLSSGGPTLGSNLLLDTLAAIVVGGTALSGGVGGVHRTLLGVLIITILANGLNQLGVGEFTQEIIKGAVIIVAVAINMVPHRRMIIK